MRSFRKALVTLALAPAVLAGMSGVAHARPASASSSGPSAAAAAALLCGSGGSQQWDRC